MELASKDDDDEDVFQVCVIDRYAARPSDLEHITLAEFAANYVTTNSNTGSKDVIECVDRKNNHLGNMRKRRKMSVIRYPRFKDGTEEYYR